MSLCSSSLLSCPPPCLVLSSFDSAGPEGEAFKELPSQEGGVRATAGLTAKACCAPIPQLLMPRFDSRRAMGADITPWTTELMQDHILLTVAIFTLAPGEGRKLSQDFCALLCGLSRKGRKPRDATSTRTGSVQQELRLEGPSFRVQFGAFLNLQVVTGSLQFFFRH
jgi:hypothetical protein